MPGGRLHKGESILAAARRKCCEEVGFNIDVFNFVGFLEEQFEDAPFGVESGVHAISFVLNAEINSDLVKLDEQSENWKFSRKLPSRLKIQPFQKGNL